MEQCNCRCRDIFTHSFVCVILQQKVTEVSCCTKGLYNSCVSAGERNKSYVVDSTSHDGMQSNFRKYIYSCCLDLVNAVAHAKMKTPTFLSVSFSYSFCLLSALNLPRHRVLPIEYSPFCGWNGKNQCSFKTLSAFQVSQAMPIFCFQAECTKRRISISIGKSWEKKSSFHFF